MTREEKIEVVKELTATLAETPNVYLTDAGGLTVSEMSDLRQLCYDAGIQLRVVKNTLMQKAMESAEGDYSEVYPALKQQTAAFFVGEQVNTPAKVIAKFRKGKEKPVLKAAYIDEAVFFGDESLKALESMKSKNDLIADLIALLQAPMMNMMSQLNAGNTVAGLLKALEERG